MSMLSIKCASIVTIITLIIGLVLISFGAYTAYYTQPEQTTLEIELAGYDAQGNRIFTLLSSNGKYDPSTMQVAEYITTTAGAVIDRVELKISIVWSVSPSTWKPSVSVGGGSAKFVESCDRTDVAVSKWSHTANFAIGSFTATDGTKTQLITQTYWSNDFINGWGTMSKETENFRWKFAVSSLGWSCTDDYGESHSGTLNGEAQIAGYVHSEQYEIAASVEITSISAQIAGGMFNEAVDSTYSMANQVSTPIPILSIVLIVAGVATIVVGLLSAKRVCMVTRG